MSQSVGRATKLFSLEALVLNLGVVDPRFRHKNTPYAFGGASYELGRASGEQDEVAVEAVRRFIEEHGAEPNQYSWAAAGMGPSERTIRRSFGSFRAAVELAVSAIEGGHSTGRRVLAPTLSSLPRPRDANHHQRAFDASMGPSVMRGT